MCEVAVFAEGGVVVAGEIKAVRFGGTVSLHVGPEAVFGLELIYDVRIKKDFGNESLAVCLGGTIAAEVGVCIGSHLCSVGKLGLDEVLVILGATGTFHDIGSWKETVAAKSKQHRGQNLERVRLTPDDEAERLHLPW